MKTLAIAIAALVCCYSATYAEDRARDEVRGINFDTVLKKPDGTPIYECGPKGDAKEQSQCVSVTLGMVAYNALNSPAKNGTSINDNVARYRLQLKVFSGSSVQLSAVEVAQLIAAINERGYPTDYAGQTFCLLDPATYCRKD